MSSDSDPHDRLFKDTFSNIQHLELELRAVLPPSLTQAIDFSTLHVARTEFEIPGLSPLQGDLLVEAHLKGQPALILFLVEHQSETNKLMPLRTLGYQFGAWTHHVKQRRAQKMSVLPLPVIIPILVHHSKKGWTVATQFQELFDPRVLAVEGVAEFLPQFRLLLDDISHQSDDELMRRALGHAEPIVPVVLWALRDARNGPRLIASLKVWAATIEQMWRTPHGQDAVQDVFSYISKVTEAITVEEITQAVEQTAPATQEVIMTLAEQWMRQGEAKGRVEGEAKGRVEGEARALVGMIERLCKSCGIELTEQRRTTLATASLDELQRIVDCIALDRVWPE